MLSKVNPVPATTLLLTSNYHCC